MKKKVISSLVCSGMLLAFSVTAFAVPSNTCKTTITSANHNATGITQCSQATYCSVSLEAKYSEGIKKRSASGVVACNAMVQVNSPYEFITANSQHRIEYYDNGYLNVYKTGTGATAK